jgi:predicted transcriptional regulator/transcriptional regulator with XRE-family HTH domain
MESAFVGGRLRQLREERRLNQAELAKALQISPSYLNQLEHNSRPLTVPVLLRISEVFGVDASFFAPQDTTRLVAELGEVLLDDEFDAKVSSQELGSFVSSQPGLAQAVVTMHRRYRHALEQLGQLSADGSAPLMPHEQVRDFFYSNLYIGVLDDPAEKLAAEFGPRRVDVRDSLVSRLREQHQVRVVERDYQSLAALHRFDPDTGVLAVAANLRPNQQAFRLARQLALLEFGPVLTAVADEAGLVSQDAHALAIIGLANYFAAAVILPYERFRSTAEDYRYDVERLAAQFEVSFETVCHRLSTLQRPRARGVPFSFVRVDRAGNVSKRLSATPFHFSRTGGTCPLWNVYEAFASPGKVLTQLASMPDGRHYLWVARTITRSPGRYGAPSKMFAVGLGCETRHAGRLVYSAGLDLTDRESATPIGMGCKMCERPSCAQRAFPPLGRALAVDQNRTTFAAYPVAGLEPS